MDKNFQFDAFARTLFMINMVPRIEAAPTIFENSGVVKPSTVPQDNKKIQVGDEKPSTGLSPSFHTIPCPWIKCST